MTRRTCVTSLMAAAALPAAATGAGIQLHVDLQVDLAKEQQMLKIFHGPFRAAAAKQPGFIDVKMMKLRTALQGAAPPHANYRFVLRFQSEKQRQAWVATAIHGKLWPQIEETLASKEYTVLLYDVE